MFGSSSVSYKPVRPCDLTPSENSLPLGHTHSGSMADDKHTLNSLQAHYASDPDDQAETAADPAVRVAALAESEDLAPGSQANAKDVSDQIVPINIENLLISRIPTALN